MRAKRKPKHATQQKPNDNEATGNINIMSIGKHDAFPIDLFALILQNIPAFPYFFSLRGVSKLWQNVIENIAYDQVTCLNFCLKTPGFKKFGKLGYFNSQQSKTWVFEFLGKVFPNVHTVFAPAVDCLKYFSNVHTAQILCYHPYIHDLPASIKTLHVYGANITDITTTNDVATTLHYCNVAPAARNTATLPMHEYDEKKPSTVLEAMVYFCSM